MLKFFSYLDANSLLLCQMNYTSPPIMFPRILDAKLSTAKLFASLMWPQKSNATLKSAKTSLAEKFQVLNL